VSEAALPGTVGPKENRQWSEADIARVPPRLEVLDAQFSEHSSDRS
jgi:hypothetical protein